MKEKLTETAAWLRDMAERLERQYREITLPVQEISVKDAASRIRLLTDGYFSINCELTWQTRKDSPEPSWGVYLGATQKQYLGESLAKALNAAIAAICPPDPPEAAVVLAEAEELTGAESIHDPLPL